MKISPKQVAIAILCVIIAFIPTYIAVTYYFMKDGSPDRNNYSVVIKDETEANVSTMGQNQKDLAKTVLAMNKAMYAVNAYIIPEELPERYYDITVTAGKTTERYRYYFSIEGDKTVVYDFEESVYFYIDFDDVKEFLSTPSARSFYTSSKLPVLSISGGNDVTPTELDWQYRTVSGEMAKIGNVETVTNAPIYSMNSATRLSFDVAPDRCSVRVSQNGTVIAAGYDLNCIPYAKLDQGALSFEIYAEWNSSSEYSGYAKYRFTSTVGLAPVFSVDRTSVESGEFILVCAKNVTSPEKIGFVSSPSIDFDPVFFEENGVAYALIPFDKNLEAPQKYTLTFTYGESRNSITVNVSQRERILEKHYDVSGLDVSRTESAINEYTSLLSEIGLKCEDTRYFNDKFIGYELIYTQDISNIVLGYGHIRKPSSGDEPFRLDGVDYFIASGTNVTAIASGKVVYVGESELLGKFVVIDHGLGLKTWYCGLSETLTTVGSTVVKDGAIGKPGSTGYKTSRGVYLITTVMNVPVCPYYLQSDGLDFPK